MSGKNGQRKPGTARGSPRRSRTAKASHISRRAVKLRCACERGGWGRLSDDGSGHDNPNRSEGPWGMWRHLMAARNRARRDRLRAVPMTRSRGARRTDANQAMAGACRERLKLVAVLGRPRLKGQPSSRTGENSPYGMIGGIEETSASFEVRSAPRSYPTVADDVRTREVAPRHSSEEAGEQSGRTLCGASCRGKARGGAGGAKGGGQGECGPAKHAPDSAPGERVTGAGKHTEGGQCRLCRHPPEVGEAMGRAAEVVAPSSSI
jgi:hypothetical protein